MMARHFKKSFLVTIGILVVALNHVFVASETTLADGLPLHGTTEEEDVTDAAERLGTTEKEYVTDAPELLYVNGEKTVTDAPGLRSSTEKQNVTDAAELLGSTKELHVTDAPNPLGATENEYFTEGPELLDTTEEQNAFSSAELHSTTKEKYFTEGPELLVTNTLNAAELLGTTEGAELLDTNTFNAAELLGTTEGAELLGTSEEGRITDAPIRRRTTEEEPATDAAELLGTTEEDNVTDASAAVIGRTKESRSCNKIYIWLIIIGILTILCTILLVSTIALAYQASNLKARMGKRSVRSNSDFIKTGSLWSNGAREVPGDSADTNILLEEVRPLKDEDEAKLPKSTEDV